jgi:hypothetical protein
MHIKLEINAESVEQFDAAVARFAPKPSIGGGEWGDTIKLTPEPARGSTAAEAETPLDPPATGTKTRQRRTGAGATAAPQESASEPTPATAAEETEEHPLLVAKTLADVKALGNKKVSELGAGPIQQLLVESFGVRAFGSLDPADFDRAYAALEALK